MSIPGSALPLLLTSAAGAAAGYEIERSLRINSADSAYLNRTPSAGNQKTWTWSGWVKRSLVSGSDLGIFGARGTSATFLRFKTNQLDFVVNGLTHRRTTAQFRDYSAWYHFVWAVDTTQATASDRSHFYVNGTEVTAWNIDSALTLDQLTEVNGANTHLIGATDTVPNDKLDAYIADFYFIDGQQLAATDFGEFDATTGAWNPIAYSGTYPGNSFHLDFRDNSSASALGTDSSGNGNDWTVNNIGVPATYTFSNGWTANLLAGFPGTNCFNGTGTGLTIGGSNVVSTWTAPTSLPFSTLTIRGAHDGATIRINGTDVTSQFTSGLSVVTVTGVSSPLSTIALDGSSGAGNPRITSVVIDGERLVDSRPFPGNGNDSLFDSPTNGTQTNTGAGAEISGNYCTWNPLVGRYNDAGQSGTAPTFSNGNLDVSGGQTNDRIAGTFHFNVGQSEKYYWEVTFTGTPASSNGAGVRDYSAGTSTQVLKFWYYDGSTTDGGPATSFTTGDVLGFAMDLSAGTIDCYKNGGSSVGQMDISSLTSVTPFVAANSGVGVVGNFGQRAYAYTAPSGFKALCTANFDTPTIEDPSTVMDVVLWTYTSSITMNMGPDLVWMKRRNSTGNHAWIDTVRTNAKHLESDNTNAEATESTPYISSFNTDGFSLNNTIFNNGNSMVGWCWDAGTSTASNTSGSITSQVRANISAGFSIVTYSAGASGSTVGHGLGVAPQLIIAKSRTVAQDWVVYHSVLGSSQYILLSSTAAAGSLTNYWGTVGSSTFGVSNNGFLNNKGDMIAYCWAPVEGYSAFGGYTGNGSTNGPFVYTGFRPKWLMVKVSNQSDNWVIVDAERNTYNSAGLRLFPNTSGAESSFYSEYFDLLSNGFKARSNDGGSNASSDTYIWAAFAESPFAYARAR